MAGSESASCLYQPLIGTSGVYLFVQASQSRRFSDLLLLGASAFFAHSLQACHDVAVARGSAHKHCFFLNVTFDVCHAGYLGKTCGNIPNAVSAMKIDGK
jgi:hypothetical protein